MTISESLTKQASTVTIGDSIPLKDIHMSKGT